MSNDMNELMRRFEEVNAKEATGLKMPDDIEVIVAYHRAQRARKASGEKITKPKIDISQITQKLTNAVKADAPKFGRRI